MERPSSERSGGKTFPALPSSTWMAREIHEQPAVLAQTLSSLRRRRPELRRLVAGTRSVLFFGRGSSRNAAVYGCYLAEAHAGVPSRIEAPSLATRYRARLDLAGALAVVISQSGATQEMLEAAQWASACGARTLAITNDGASSLAEVADLALVTAAGPERAVPATKTYLSALGALLVLVCALSPEDGALGAWVPRLPGLVADLLTPALSERAMGVAAQLQGVAAVVVCGRGYTYGSALEISLKLAEAARLAAFGVSRADFQHGPLAMLSPRVATVLVAPSRGPVLEEMGRFAQVAIEAGSRTLLLGGDATLSRTCAGHLPGPDVPEALSPFFLAPAGQLLAEALARRLGLDPDRPAGLHKVTQTDAPTGR